MAEYELYAMPLLRINAPEWYKDEKWLLWLCSREPATWHRHDKPVGEYSDVFFIHGDSYNGSDYPSAEGRPGIPDHIWETINAMCGDAFGDEDKECLVWVSNLGG